MVHLKLVSTVQYLSLFSYDGAGQILMKFWKYVRTVLSPFEFLPTSRPKEQFRKLESVQLAF